MKQYKLKDIYKSLGQNDVLLFDSAINTYYPDIEGNESNFLTDYGTLHAYIDGEFAHKFGERVIDLEADTLSQAVSEFKGITTGVCLLNIQNWARLYYALSLDYNPLYNVDGLTTYTHGAQSETYSYGKDKTTSQFGATQDTMQYGATQDTTQYGATQDTTEYGATSETLGTHTDTSTEYAVSYDSATEKEKGKTSNTIGSQTNTSLLHTDVSSSILHSDVASSIQHTDTASSIQHTDTNERDARTDGKTSLQYIDTELRQGNIGVTKSTELLADTYKLYTEHPGFWDTIFKTLANDGGLYYDYYSV